MKCASSPHAEAAEKRLNHRLRQTSWFHPFAYKRFHVLLNSLFKVLCNFPSRYLFAIGLAVIFSLSWSLPADLGCTLKQPDSNMHRLAQWMDWCYGTCTHYGRSFSKELAPSKHMRSASLHSRSTALILTKKAFTLGSFLFTRRY
jgi:hypothetical protein